MQALEVDSDGGGNHAPEVGCHVADLMGIAVAEWAAELKGVAQSTLAHPREVGNWVFFAAEQRRIPGASASSNDQLCGIEGWGAGLDQDGEVLHVHQVSDVDGEQYLGLDDFHGFFFLGFAGWRCLRPRWDAPHAHW